ncbi:MAG: transglycosylase SLT domain-containing protein [Bryobacterales bacterium]|nr:transglycosylase SLT domain-containing protein [Bryobacterales bacterium]
MKHGSPSALTRKSRFGIPATLSLLLPIVVATALCQGPSDESSRLSDFAHPALEAALSSGDALLNRNVPVPRLARFEALDAASTYFRRGRVFAEQAQYPQARAELNRSLEILLSSQIDFSSDTLAKRELESLIQEIHRLDVTRMGIGETSTGPVYVQPPLEDIPELTFPIDPSLEATVVDMVRARSGDFPLQVNENVLSYVRYFTSERGRRTFIAGYRRSGRYRDMIFRILDEEGLPRELLHLAQAESGFIPRAMSWAKAGGLWQFVPSRGKEYGLNQTPLTDDRFDPEKATRAAAKHLRDLYHEFGDWNLAMAAYNCGPGCVARAVERTGYAGFWELRRRNAIPRETTNYVPIVQALAIIAMNPAAYGIELPEPDPPLDFDSHVLEAKTHLNLVADIVGVTKAELRELNPSVRGDLAPAGHTLRVPKQSIPLLLSGLKEIPTVNRVAWRAHRVNDGDTLQAIATQYRTTATAISKANEVTADSVRTGDLLLIPAAYAAPAARSAARKPAARKSATRKPVARKPAAEKSSARK